MVKHHEARGKKKFQRLQKKKKLSDDLSEKNPHPAIFKKSPSGSITKAERALILESYLYMMMSTDDGIFEQHIVWCVVRGVR